MQIREQWTGSRNWKLVTGAATAATLGLGALVIAIPGGADQAPPSISLDERAVAGGEAAAGGFVPFDLSAFTGLHADRVVHDDPYFGGGFFWGTQPLAAESRADQTGSAVASPVTDGPAGAASDEVSASGDADGTTSTDVLSEGVDAADDGAADETVTDGPAVAIGDDSLSDDSFSDDAADLVSDDEAAIGDDSFESVSDDVAALADDDDSDDSDDSISDDSVDSDDSLDNPDDSD